MIVMFVGNFFVKSLNANGDRVEEGKEAAAEGGWVTGMGVSGGADYNAISAFSISKQMKGFIRIMFFLVISFNYV
jgi:hypothetical protein